MGARGPAPTPTKLLEARGSWRAKTRKGEPRPPTAKPACPQWLPKEAKAEWRRQVKRLEEVGIIAQIDRALLTAWCEAWAEFVETSKQIAKEGFVLKSKEAGLYQHPAVAIRNKAFDRLHRLGQQFGFSPSARARLNIQSEGEKPKDNAKARFFKPRVASGT